MHVMKSSRKIFLAGAALGVGAVLLPSPRMADKAFAATPSPTPAPVPTPSPAALDLARGMRRFDPQLSDAEVEKIAQGIEQGYGFGSALNPHGTFLRNGDAPVPQFAVRP